MLRTQVVERRGREANAEPQTRWPRVASELWVVFSDRRLWSGTPARTILILIAINLATVIWHDPIVMQRQQNLMIGGTVISGTALQVIQPESGGKVRYDHSVGEDLDAYWNYIPDARQEPLVVLAGMSQNYAVNDWRPGDKTIPEWLDDELVPRGTRAFGLAAPNLSTEEALFLLLATASDPRTHPDSFIYAVCFDKLRNIDVRPGYQQFLRERPALQQLWQHTAQTAALAHATASEKMLATLAGLNEVTNATPALTQTATHSLDFESSVQDRLGQLVPMFGVRKELNVGLQLRLYFARNALFGITPTSKRPMIASRYETNLDLLSLMADVAQHSHVQLILYVNPLNPVADNPYIPEEYAAFKTWISEFSSAHKIPYANFENIVPNDVWGEFMGEPDFKHFGAEGHRITAEAILQQFGGLIPNRS